MNRYQTNNQDGDSPAQKKLFTYLLKRNPNLSQKEIPSVLNSIKRFVNLARKIYTEPQAQVTYEDRKIGTKIQKTRIFNTDIKELSKVMDTKAEPIEEVFRKFHKSVTRRKND